MSLPLIRWSAWQFPFVKCRVVCRLLWNFLGNLMFADFEKVTRNPEICPLILNVHRVHECPIAQLSLIKKKENHPERVKFSWTSKKSMFGKQNKRRKNNVRWKVKNWSASTTTNERCVIIQAWRIVFAPSLVSTRATLQQAGAGWKMESFLYSILVSVYKTPRWWYWASSKHVQDFPRNREKLYGAWLWLWSEHQHSRSHFHKKSLLPRNEDICVHEEKKLQRSKREIAINSTARTESRLVKVHRSLWSYHIQVLLFLLWRLVCDSLSYKFTLCEWIRSRFFNKQSNSAAF